MQSLPQQSTTEIRISPNDSRLRTPAQVYADSESFGTTLLIVALDLFETECLDWSPLTLTAELEAETGVAIPGVNIDKVCEAIRLLTTNEFFVALPDFIRACNVLSNKSNIPELTDPVAEPAEVAWGVCEAVLLTPLDPKEVNFSTDVSKYTGMLLDEYGFGRTPSMLSFADRQEPDVSQPDAELQVLTTAIADDRVREVEQEVQKNMELLISQVSSLSLRNGKTRGILDAIQKRVREFQDVD